MWSAFRSAAIAVVCAVRVATADHSQAPPAIDVSGTWTLDTYLSDSAQQVAASIRADLGQNDLAMFPGPPEGGRFGRGMGRRGQPPPEGSNRPTTPLNAEEQRALDAVTRPVRFPAPTLHIAQTAAAVTVDDAHGQSRTFDVTGKREQQMFDTTRAESSARYEGPQLVIDFDLGKGRKMTYTYSIVPTTRQLLVRVTFERAPNQPGPFEIKIVYNRASG
jgi:hypothetical protein